VRTHLPLAAALLLAHAATAATAPDRHGSFPSASPDGRRIAFASSRAAPVPAGESAWLHMHIYLMDADGNHPRQLTHTGTSDTAPIWSPDGKWIYFGAIDVAHHRETLEAVTPDGRERHTVLQGHFLPWARLSPDGSRLIYTATEGDSPAGIFTIRTDGTDIQPLSTGLQRPWDGIYSPDGKRLVFAEWPPDPDQSKVPPLSRVYIADADGAHRRLLATYPALIQVPSWSFDGRSLAYQTYTGKKGTADILVLDVASGAFRFASGHPGTYLDETPSWLPDGRILFQSTRSGRFEIYVMNADGSGVTLLTR
jgi:TolB protein